MTNPYSPTLVFTVFTHTSYLGGFFLQRFMFCIEFRAAVVIIFAAGMIVYILGKRLLKNLMFFLTALVNSTLFIGNTQNHCWHKILLGNEQELFIVSHIVMNSSL